MILGSDKYIEEMVRVTNRDEKCRELSKTDFILQAPYRVWVDILRGKLGATQALVTRKLQVRGNFIRLMMTGDSTIRWVTVLQSIPTKFDGTYSQYSFAAK